MKVWTEIRGDEVHHGNSSCWSWRKFAKFAESESEGNLRNDVGNFNFIGSNIMKSVRTPPSMMKHALRVCSRKEERSQSQFN